MVAMMMLGGGSGGVTRGGIVATVIAIAYSNPVKPIRGL